MIKQSKPEKRIRKASARVAVLRQQGIIGDAFSQAMFAYRKGTLKFLKSPGMVETYYPALKELNYLSADEIAWIDDAIAKRDFVAKEKNALAAAKKTAREARHRELIESPLIGELTSQLIENLKVTYQDAPSQIERELCEWISDIVLNGTRCIAEIENTGYDCSSRGRQTDEPYNIDDYKTVGQFLDEPNGNTTATYMSGSGFAAESLSSDFDRIVFDLLHQWVNQEFAKIAPGQPDDLKDYVFDEFWERCADGYLDNGFWVERLSARPFRQIVESCANKEGRQKLKAIETANNAIAKAMKRSSVK